MGRSNIRKDFFTLLSGNSLAQAITLLAAPILTRLYSPAEYGVLGSYMAIAAVFSTLATVQYSEAVLYAETDDDAATVAVLGFVISLLCTFIALFVVVLGQDMVSRLFPELGEWLLLLPCSILLAACTSILTMWANRLGQYGKITKSRVFISIFTVCLSLGFGFIHSGVFGLMVSLICGQLLGVMVLFRGINVNHIKGVRYTAEKFRGNAWKYRKFPLYTLPSEFLNRLSNQLPIFFLSLVGGANAIGLFMRARQMLSLPVTQISGALGPVFKERANRQFLAKGECSQLYRKMFLVLFAAGTAPALLLFIFADDLFALAFGESWRNSGEYARILTVMYFMNFVVAPLANMFTIANRQHEDFYCHIYMMLSSALLLFLGYYYFHSVEKMLLFFSINYSLIYLYYLVRGYFLSRGLV